MKSFEKKYLDVLHLPPSAISLLTALSEFKGKEELYRKQSPDVLKSMLETAKIESVESSNRIEGVTAPHERIEAIVRSPKSTPRNRPEEEIAGYRDALSRIHEMHEGMDLSNNVILMFHQMLFSHTTIKAGQWKKGDNEIAERLPDGSMKLRFKPVPALKTAESMEDLIRFYRHADEQDHIEPLILIPLFIFDFLCVHPFKDGNGRVGRLLTLLLLYQSGFDVGKYVSLERVIEQSKDSYYETLKASSEGWHEGTHDVLPWLRYFYGMLLAAYKEFESRVGIFKKSKSKSGRITEVVLSQTSPFSVSQIRDACPEAGIDLIRKLLKDLHKSGKIEPLSRGRYARWRLIR